MAGPAPTLPGTIAPSARQRRSASLAGLRQSTSGGGSELCPPPPSAPPPPDKPPSCRNGEQPARAPNSATANTVVRCIGPLKERIGPMLANGIARVQPAPRNSNGISRIPDSPRALGPGISPIPRELRNRAISAGTTLAEG